MERRGSFCIAGVRLGCTPRRRHVASQDGPRSPSLVLAVGSESAAPLCSAVAPCVAQGGCVLASTDGPGPLLSSAGTEPGSVLCPRPLLPSWRASRDTRVSSCGRPAGPWKRSRSQSEASVAEVPCVPPPASSRPPTATVLLSRARSCPCVSARVCRVCSGARAAAPHVVEPSGPAPRSLLGPGGRWPSPPGP